MRYYLYIAQKYQLYPHVFEDILKTQSTQAGLGSLLSCQFTLEGASGVPNPNFPPPNVGVRGKSPEVTFALSADCPGSLRPTAVSVINRSFQQAVGSGWLPRSTWIKWLERTYPQYQTTDQDGAHLSLMQELVNTTASYLTSRPKYYSPLFDNCYGGLHGRPQEGPHSASSLLSAYIESVIPAHVAPFMDAIHILLCYANLCPTETPKGPHPKNSKAGAHPVGSERSRGWRLLTNVVEGLFSSNTASWPAEVSDWAYWALNAGDQPHPIRIQVTLSHLRTIISDVRSSPPEHLSQAKTELHRIFKYGIQGLVLGYSRPANHHVASLAQPYLKVPDGHYVCTARIRVASGRRWLKPLRALFPDTSPTDARHKVMSVDHLVWRLLSGCKVNPKAARQLGATKGARMSAVNHVLSKLPVGTNQILTMCSLLVGCCARQADIFDEQILCSNMLLADRRQQHSRLKVLSQLYRKTARTMDGTTLEPDQVTSLAYFELAFGRSANKSNWEEEAVHRCHTRHHIVAPRAVHYDRNLVAKFTALELGQGAQEPDQDYHRLMAAEIDKLLKPIITKKQVSETFANFYGRRQEWIASGSSAGYRLPNTPSNGQFAGMPVNKRVWAENTPLRHVQKFMAETKPIELATASEKFENGKSRAIYGVVPEHYVINSYVTAGMEERLHLIEGLEKGASGLAELAYVYKRLAITRDPDHECSMLDYADFNIHHTPEMQALLFERISARGQVVGACKDWVNAAKWLSKAKMNQQVIFPKSGRPQRVTQGMFSGTRSTDLINTLLNIAYFNVAAKCLEEQHIEAVDLYHVHQGDDLWVSNRNAMWARSLYYTLSAQGFIFQPAKQMFGAARGEFLRVLYQKGTANGYLARALVNALLKPIQNSMDIGALEWAQAAKETSGVLHRRGLNTFGATIVWEDYIEKRALFKAHSRDNKPVSIPKLYLYTAPEFGGLGITPPTMVYTGTVAPQAIDVPMFHPPSEAAFKPTTLMTDDWVAYISARAHAKFPRHLAEALHVQQLKEALTLDNYSTMYAQQYSRLIARAAKKAAADAAAAAARGRSVNTADIHFVQDADEAVRIIRDMVPHPPPTPVGNRAYIPRHLEWAMHHPDKANPIPKLSNAFKRLTANSMFKTESRIAQAFGVGPMKALELLLSEVLQHAKPNPALVQMLSAILHHGNDRLLGLLQSGTSSIFQTAAAWLDPKYINYIVQMAHEFVLVQTMMRDPTFAGNAFSASWINMATSSQLLTQTPYPASLITY